MVDVFSIAASGTSLQHLQGTKIIPPDKDPANYWADEVRLSRSRSSQQSPKYLYASTRGLHEDTMGYVAVFEIAADGMIVGQSLDIFQTATSGGLANAIEPAPTELLPDSPEYLALTDSQEGRVSILSFNGRAISEVANVQLKTDDGEIATAATAVWL